MKRILTTLFVIGLFAVAGSIFAQESLSTTYLGTPTATLDNTKADETGNWFYKISGKFKRSADEDVYLVLQRTKKSNGAQDYVDLCRFAAGSPNPQNFSYPNCPGGPSGGISTGLFTAEYDYIAYLSDKSKGFSIDENDVLIYFDEPFPESTGNVVVTNIIATPKLLNGKNYYEIKATINETKLGKSIVFSVIKKGTTGNGEIIGNVDYTISDVVTPTRSEIQNIGNLESGEYSLRISEIGGEQLQPLIVIPNIPEGGNENDNGNQSIVGTIQTLPSGGSLVTKECGYNLGPGEKGRICGFADFISLIQRVIEYIFVLILPIAAIVFAYAGFLFITSGGDPAKRTAAKTAMTKLIIGIVVIMMAWLVVKVVLTSLGVTAGFKMFLDI